MHTDVTMANTSKPWIAQKGIINSLISIAHDLFILILWQNHGKLMFLVTVLTLPRKQYRS